MPPFQIKFGYYERKREKKQFIEWDKIKKSLKSIFNLRETQFSKENTVAWLVKKKFNEKFVETKHQMFGKMERFWR